MKKILIVGATSGIGEGLARWYAEHGNARIGVTGRRRERLEDLRQWRPGVFETEACDVTDTVAMEAALERLAARLAGKRLPVAVTDVRPGFVDTAMAKGEGLFWVAPVEKACRQIVRAIGRRKRVAYVTRRWRIAAWIYRHLPDFLFLRMGG